MSNIKTYTPEYLRKTNSVFELIKPGDVCWFDRYPFWVIYPDQLETLYKHKKTEVHEVFDLYKSKIFDITHEDKFVLLDVVSISLIPINLGKFLFENQIIYIAECDIRDTIMTVQTI